MSLVATLISNPARPALAAPLAQAARAAVGGGDIVWLAENVACDIPLPGDANSDAAAAALHDAVAGQPVDVAVQETAGRRKKLLLADMDSTMIEQECIDELADEIGIKERVAAITARAMNGEIAFEPALRERVALLAGLELVVIERLIEHRITLAPGGPELVATMNAAGAWTALISGGFDLFTGPIAGKLGFREHRANRLVETGGRLAGEVVEPILGRSAKAAALARHLRPPRHRACRSHRRRRRRQRPRHAGARGQRRGVARQAVGGRAGALQDRPRRPHRAPLPARLPGRRVRPVTPIETERLVIRNWRDDDAPVFHRINSDERVMEFFPFRRSRAESDETMQRLARRIEEDGYGFTPLEVRATGECIGFCGISPVSGIPTLPDGAIEIGWRLVPEAWGKGYASEAARALLTFGFDTLGFEEIVSFAVAGNRRSTDVMRRLGMRRDPPGDFDHPRVPDTHRHLQRHVLYRLTREEWKAKGAA